MSAYRVAIALVGLTLISACGGRHHLDEYHFTNKSIALVYIDPPAPELLHGWYDVRPSEKAVQAVFRAGASVAKEIEARRASVRFDSASRGIDFRRELAERTLERASRYLGTRATSNADSADFVLEVQVRSFGLDARSNHATYLFTRAEAVLLDRRTGREIWNENVRGSDRMTPLVFTGPQVPSAAVSAIALSTVTVADFRQALGQLVGYTSNLITGELRDKLRDVRD